MPRVEDFPEINERVYLNPESKFFHYLNNCLVDLALCIAMVTHFWESIFVLWAVKGNLNGAFLVNMYYETVTTR